MTPLPSFAAPESHPREIRPLSLDPFAWIDWIVSLGQWLLSVVWNLATIPINAARFYLGAVADAAVSAWAYLTGVSKYTPQSDLGWRNVMKLGMLPYARTGLTLAQQGFGFLNDYLVEWARPHTALLANLGTFGLKPLGGLLGEMLSHSVIVRGFGKLLAPLFEQALSATEELIAAVELRIGEAFTAWQSSLNLSIAWSNWLFDPAGALRHDPWVATLMRYAEETLAGILNGLWSGVPVEVQAAQLNAQFPPRPPSDVVNAFADGRTAALPEVQAALALFNSAG